MSVKHSETEGASAGAQRQDAPETRDAPQAWGGANWIEKRMRERGMTVRQLALRARIGMRLIYILMQGDQTSVTHPRIAERIAEILGATDAEWDSIVPEDYRGQRQKYAPKQPRGKAREVKCVKVIDRKGRTLHV